MKQPAPHSSDTMRVVRRYAVVGLGVNCAVAAAKIAGGILGHSDAVVADGVHSLSDLATDLLLLLAVRYWTHPPDPNHPYGHGRIETLVSLFLALSLAGVGLVLGVHAAQALWRGDAAAPPTGEAVAAALVSIAAKEWLYRITKAAARTVRSSALEANAWHHRTDVLSSLPVVVAAATASVWPAAWWIDDGAVLLVAGFIAYAAWDILRPALYHLSDSGASPEIVARIEQTARDTAGVAAVHAVRTRWLGGQVYVDMHVEVAPTCTVQEGHDIATAVQRRVDACCEEVGDVLVHIEPHDPAR